MNMRLKTGEPEQITPGQFFNNECAKILTAQKAICEKLGGTYGIQLLGADGGAWTLDLSKAAISPGLAEKTDLYFEMNTEDFSKMMRGKLDVLDATTHGRLRINGNAKLFSNLAAVFQFPQ